MKGNQALAIYWRAQADVYSLIFLWNSPSLVNILQAMFKPLLLLEKR